MCTEDVIALSVKVENDCALPRLMLCEASFYDRTQESIIEKHVGLIHLPTRFRLGPLHREKGYLKPDALQDIFRALLEIPGVV